MNTATKPPPPPKPLAPCAGLFGAWCVPDDAVANDRDHSGRNKAPEEKQADN